MIAVAEIIRRCLWGFLRVELESIRLHHSSSENLSDNNNDSAITDGEVKCTIEKCRIENLAAFQSKDEGDKDDVLSVISSALLATDATESGMYEQSFCSNDSDEQKKLLQCSDIPSLSSWDADAYDLGNVDEIISDKQTPIAPIQVSDI
eukprot:CAMPEP_0171325080 /NCGR_PEP_ID=MMETSP0816-20121228/116587_1 /TAXON_ID=420281 /ORGANISM="Proboscia inermis, Strain CCAP1064/1" /LENGTH=148 /DNA_ID=CAMNT_0011824169 /DNA_START=1555 /DNA_END=2002 /DNA_ORIENTATION=-